MKSMNSKNFRADTEEKRERDRAAQRKVTAVCIAVAAIAVILLFAGVKWALGGKTQQSASMEELQQNLKDRMQEEMQTASAYLEKLDGSIAENQEKLNEVTAQLMERQNSLLEVETTQRRLTENAAGMTEQVTELDKRTTTQIQDLKTSMNSVQGQIRETLKKIEEMMRTMEEQEVASQQDAAKSVEEIRKVEQSVLEVRQYVDGIGSNLNQTHESLRSLLLQLSDSGAGRDSEILTRLSSVENNLKRLLESDVAQIMDSMEKFSTEYQAKLDKMDQMLQGRLQELSEGVSGLESGIDSLQADVKSLDENVSSGMNKLGEDMNSGMSKLGEDMNSGMNKLGEDMNSGMNKLGEDMNSGMDKLGENMDSGMSRLEENMNSGMDKLGEDMNSGMNKLGEDMNSGMDKLGENMDSGMSKLGENVNSSVGQIGDSVSGLQNALGGLDEKLSGSVNGMNQGMDGLTKSLQASFEKLQQTIVKHLGDVNIQSGSNSESIKSYIDQVKQELKQDLNQVFTSVSSGKKGLASALLTKAVSVNENATFAEIRDAILRIDQKVVIGVQEIPGSITYEYHYHVNGAGEYPHAEVSAKQGGCYTVQVNHVHSKEAGCYREESYHSHSDSCPGHPEWVDWAGIEPYWGWFYDCEDQPLNASRQVLDCDKDEGVADGYAAACGLAEGQIIGATIVYNREAVESAALEKLRTVDKTPGTQVVASVAQTSEAEKPPRAPEAVAQEMERKRQEELAQKQLQESTAGDADPIESGRETQQETKQETAAQDAPETVEQEAAAQEVPETAGSETGAEQEESLLPETATENVPPETEAEQPTEETEEEPEASWAETMETSDDTA